MHTLDPNEAFDHSKVPVVMFHPGQNDGADVTVVPVLPVQGLVNSVKLVIVDRRNGLPGKGKGATRVIKKQVFWRVRRLMPVWA